jgi:hypothetical protein
MKPKTILIITLLIAVSFACPAQSTTYKQIADTSRQVKTFTGELIGWAVNSDYIFEGFYLQVACTKYLVMFSPNMGKKLRRKIKANTILSIDGAEVISTSNEKVIRLVSFKDEDGNTHDIPTAVITKEKLGRVMKGKSQISALQKNNQGKDEGFVLDNQIILRMPLENLEKMKKIALVGTKVSYSGEKQKLSSGEAAQMDYTVILCNSMTIDGKEYLTR